MSECERCPLKAARANLISGDDQQKAVSALLLAFFPNGCPAWVDGEVERGMWLQESAPGGEARVVKGCAFQIFFIQMSKAIAASNRPAEEISSMRGEHERRSLDLQNMIEKGLNANSQNLVQGLASLAGIMAAIPGVGETLKELPRAQGGCDGDET